MNSLQRKRDNSMLYMEEQRIAKSHDPLSKSLPLNIQVGVDIINLPAFDPRRKATFFVDVTILQVWKEPQEKTSPFTVARVRIDACKLTLDQKKRNEEKEEKEEKARRAKMMQLQSQMQVDSHDKGMMGWNEGGINNEGDTDKHLKMGHNVVMEKAVESHGSTDDLLVDWEVGSDVFCSFNDTITISKGKSCPQIDLHVYQQLRLYDPQMLSKGTTTEINPFIPVADRIGVPMILCVGLLDEITTRHGAVGV